MTDTVIIDVREVDEYEAEHVPFSINLPLSKLDRNGPGLLKAVESKKAVIMCRTGRRAGMAIDQLSKIDALKTKSFSVFEGGIVEWKKQGLKTNETRVNSVSIMRQVQMTAGFLVIAAALASFLVNPYFAYVAGGVGFGIFYAGLSGTCAMADVLAKMPWNK